MDRKLRIAIDCRIGDPKQGIGTAVIALAKALSDSPSMDQEYIFIVLEGMHSWLAPYIHGSCSLAIIPLAKSAALKTLLKPIAPLRLVWHKLSDKLAYIPVSDGYVESQHFDVVHFPAQVAYLTDIPTIYQPHDLQHVHYPQFFSKREFALRERYYRAFCDQASFVCVHAQWTKQDLLNEYRIAEEKIAVIPWGPVFQAYTPPSVSESKAVVEKYALPDHFFFYPAVTWPHKNHESILRALHLLKSQHGIKSSVCFTGAITEYRLVLDKLAEDLGVSDQVRFLGFLSPQELQSVFSVATAMIYPSKFEGFGLPLLEAFHAKLPVLSSNATSLPEVGGDAALYFDPDSPMELASLMKMILEVPEMRQNLVAKGTLVLAHYSIKETAAKFQALYAKTAFCGRQD